MEKIIEELIEGGYFTAEELQLLTHINGYNIDTINDCVYCRYGLRTVEDLLEEGEEDDDVK